MRITCQLFKATMVQSPGFSYGTYRYGVSLPTSDSQFAWVEIDTGLENVTVTSVHSQGSHTARRRSTGAKPGITISPCDVWCLRLARLIMHDQSGNFYTDVIMVLVESFTKPGCYERIGLINYDLGLSQLVEQMERGFDGLAYDQRPESPVYESANPESYQRARMLHAHLLEQLQETSETTIVII